MSETQSEKTRRVGVALPGVARALPEGNPYAVEEAEARRHGLELVEITSFKEDDLIEQAKSLDGVLTSWGVRFNRRVLENLERCVVIGVGSVGVDMVDVEAATEAGIVVTNVPDVFIEEVADHTLMLLLAAGRRAKIMDKMVAEGRWWEGRPLLSEVPRLWGQTLGLLSFGNVATAVARRAQPFGLRVIAYDPYVTELKLTAEGVEPVSFEELLEHSDYLSVHAPLNDETRHMLSDAEFAAMKNSAVLINAGRGPIVDEAALCRALDAGELAAAGLDVLENEPPEPDNPLLEMDQVVLSPHVASATTRMRPETRRRAAREVGLALNGRWPMSCVNPTVLPRVSLERWQPVPMQRGPNR